ncbi:MAG: FumA C-terminus/TtdB family hydratase beta subunit [Candidatus Bathyarchaeota archaeon]|nr:FumA C-terminus/TtdB family hydratase beta subunit [Candidatus Bathyarchaeota archaeon]
MAKYDLATPLSETQIRELKVYDVVYLSGLVVTARDQAHLRALDFFKENKQLSINLEGLAVFHCGPVLKKDDNQWVVVAAGPTTSTRMEGVEAEFIAGSKVRMVIGKGGMGQRTAEAMVKFGAVYCAFTGGAAVLAAQAVKRVLGVQWLDLGEPEAMWQFEVDKFGPLVVAIDTHGGNLFSDIAQKVEFNRQIISQKLNCKL